MKSIKELFNEFMVLNYINEKITIPKTFKDINLGNYVILRQHESWKIIYLTNGNIITFPKELIDLFCSLNTKYGDRLLYNIPDTDDKMECLIDKVITFICLINKGELNNITNIITDICTIGTKELRQYCKEKYNKILEPIKLDTVNKHILI